MDLKKELYLLPFLFFVFLALSFFTGCKKDNSPAPSIHRFFPVEAGHGTQLTLEGEGFGAAISENTVTLNGIAAKVIHATPEKLTVEVQKDTRCTGPERLCSGPVQVGAHGKTATAEASFTYVPQLVVSTVANLGAYSRVEGYPASIAADQEGNLFVADSWVEGERASSCILKISPEGEHSIFAGGIYSSAPLADRQLVRPYGIAIDKEGNLFVTDLFCIQGETGCVRKISPQGGEAHIFSRGRAVTGGFLFAIPSGITIDKEGNLFVTEAFGFISKVISTGEASLVSGNFTQRYPFGIVVDSAGNLYVSETSGGDSQACYCIRKMTLNAQGEEQTLSTFVDRRFVAVDGSTIEWFPEDMAIDAADNLYVPDRQNYRIWKISPEGELSTFAGNGQPGYQDGPADRAQFNSPFRIAWDAKANSFYVLDAKGDLTNVDGQPRFPSIHVRKITVE
ncbi:MAG: IPT/TIG domain-containing protein [Cystobacterineae bacterium]|nr:IPT/TIG domain-containing protein [Cystobacterineae bacterium]